MLNSRAFRRGINERIKDKRERERESERVSLKEEKILDGKS